MRNDNLLKRKLINRSPGEVREEVEAVMTNIVGVPRGMNIIKSPAKIVVIGAGAPSEKMTGIAPETPIGGAEIPAEEKEREVTPTSRSLLNQPKIGLMMREGKWRDLTTGKKPKQLLLNLEKRQKLLPSRLKKKLTDCWPWCQVQPSGKGQVIVP
jgi:hypothetical protein